MSTYIHIHTIYIIYTFHIVIMLDKIRQKNSHSPWKIVKKCREAPPLPKNKLMRRSYFFMFRKQQNNVTCFIYKQQFYTHG